MRSRCCVALLYLFLLTVSLSVFAQQPVTPQRDPAALATITRALTAMSLQSNGTLPSGTMISAVQLIGSVNPTPGSPDVAGTFTSTVEVTATGYEVRNEFQSNSGSSVFVSGHGTPGFSFGPHLRKMGGHVTMITAPSQFPMLELINAVVNPAYQVTQASALQIGAVSALHIHVSNETDFVTHAVTPQDWYFDPTTGQPLRWQFLVPDTFNAGRSIWVGSKDFANYQVMSGLLLPTQITYSRDGQPASITTVTSVQFNGPITSSLFDLPQGAN